MKSILYLFVAIAGALTSIEAGANAKLASSAGNFWWPAILFSVASLALLCLGTAVFGGPFPTAGLRAAPWWAWSGGFISAIYVVSMLIGPGQLGSGIFTGLTVTAAIVVSIALDHFGLVGFEQHTAGLGRLIGAALMIVGMLCVTLF